MTKKIDTNLSTYIQTLKAGGVVGIPTETVYGLAASIESEEGINCIFKAKERPFFDPLIVHVSSIEQAKKYTQLWPRVCDILAEKFWPGPLTFILPKAPLVFDKITSGLETVGLRMPNHPKTLELIRELGHPLAAPSANKFKKTSPTCAQDVEDEFPNIGVIDGGQCDIGIESTILGFSQSEISIYRPGMITQAQIKSTLKEFNLSLTVTYKESPISPGHLKHHYMPKTPIILKLASRELAENNLVPSHMPSSLLDSPVKWKLPDDPVMAARLLYSQFRELDKKNMSSIIIEITPSQLEDELFKGILNRLTKASSWRDSLTERPKRDK